MRTHKVFIIIGDEKNRHQVYQYPCGGFYFQHSETIILGDGYVEMLIVISA